jgi:hypothetical protein
MFVDLTLHYELNPLLVEFHSMSFQQIHIVGRTHRFEWTSSFQAARENKKKKKVENETKKPVSFNLHARLLLLGFDLLDRVLVDHTLHRCDATPPRGPRRRQAAARRRALVVLPPVDYSQETMTPPTTQKRSPTHSACWAAQELLQELLLPLLEPLQRQEHHLQQQEHCCLHCDFAN